MRAALPLGFGALALAACAAPSGAPRPASEVAGYRAGNGADGALIVTRTAAPFAYDEGAEARRAADALCGGKVASGPKDNFRDGAWHFPGGCA
ncbi:MAG: hypothetical protein R3D53_13840 [Paracoccaceae bacterium]|jgi:hypothetical protein